MHAPRPRNESTTTNTETSKVDVCFVIDRLANRSGGAERILIETANALARRGHQVQIVSHEPPGAPPFYPLEFGVMHTNLRRPQAIRSRLRRRFDDLRSYIHHRIKLPPFSLRHIFWISKHGAFQRRLELHLQAHVPNVVVAFLPPAITVLGRVRLPPGTARVASLHNVPELDLLSPQRWDPNPVDLRRRMTSLRTHDLITVLIPAFREWFTPPLRDRVRVMPNPVPQRGNKLITSERRKKTVLSVGRLSPMKRHDLLIEAAAHLTEFPDWSFEIYGNGPDQKALEEQIKRYELQDRVFLKGHVKDIDAVYKSASILCHPADYEGWGLAVSEAMAHNLVPVGYADCTGVNALISHGQNGLLVDPGTDHSARVTNLVETLRGLMQDPERRDTLGTAGPESVEQYAPEKIADLWETLLYEARKTQT